MNETSIDVSTKAAIASFLGPGRITLEAHFDGVLEGLVGNRRSARRSSINRIAL